MLENVTKSVLYGLFLSVPDGITYLGRHCIFIYYISPPWIVHGFIFREIPTRKGNMANQQISNKQVRKELKTRNNVKFKIYISVP